MLIPCIPQNLRFDSWLPSQSVIVWCSVFCTSWALSLPQVFWSLLHSSRIHANTHQWVMFRSLPEESVCCLDYWIRRNFLEEQFVSVCQWIVVLRSESEKWVHCLVDLACEAYQYWVSFKVDMYIIPMLITNSGTVCWESGEAELSVRSSLHLTLLRWLASRLVALLPLLTDVWSIDTWITAVY